MNLSRGATTRRHILSTGLFALASAFLPGAVLVQDVHADKKKKVRPVAERTDVQRDICEIRGKGKLAVLDGPDGGNTTECKGGKYDGRTCINTQTKTTCTMQLTNSPTTPGGGGAVPPSGVNEQPSDGKPVGGGAGVEPTGGVQDPGSPTAAPDGPLLYKAGRVVRPRGKGRRRRGKSRGK